MNINCPKCGIEFDDVGKWGKKKFCSRKCANSRTWSDEDKRLRRISTTSSEKYIKRLELHAAIPITNICVICNEKFNVPASRRKKKTCGGECTLKYKHIRSSEAQTKRCQNPLEKARLRDIGRKGGFGKKGYLPSGVRYESSLEKFLFEQLEVNNIKFEAHAHIPNSTKIADAFIPSKNLWVEVDGIDRDKKQKWLEQEYKYWVDKVNIYQSQNLNLTIVKNKKEILQLLSSLQ